MNSHPASPSNDDLSDTNTDFGSLLAEARKTKNHSVEEVSEYLKIPVRMIIALEANDVDSLPAQTFSQGYIRAYAKFLEISDDKVLEIYSRVAPLENDCNLKPRSNLPGEANSQSPLIKAITLLLIVGVIAIIGFGGFQYYQKKAGFIEDALDAIPQSFTGNSLDDPGTYRLNIKQSAGASDDAQGVYSYGSVDKSAEAGSKVEADEAASSASADSVTADVIKEKSVTDQDKIDSDAGSRLDTIEIIAEKGSWVEVRDANKSRLLYNMLPVGGSRELVGHAPFSVTMGNARTTRVIVNGIEIDVSDYIRSSNTVSFKVSTQGQEVIFR